MRRFISWLWLGLAALLASCNLPRAATVPLRTLAEPSGCATRPDTLIVMLPGKLSLPEEFQREGFPRRLREMRVAADVLLVDAHMAYYDNRSIVTRLHDDVVRPARAQGYRQIWFVGISLGAVGSMLYASAHPDELAGVVAIAPYLGERSIAERITAAGGLAQWRPDASLDGELDGNLWRWLQTQTSPATAGAARPLFLAYGLADRFAYSQQTLAAALPAQRVYTAEGAHEWSAWNLLWPRVVEALPIARDPACGGA